ncbi:hypothetical protein C1H46_038574 [Malus baccata]|uniref:Uncharacterized protein n=1 Tax=Malus baccata TaxID=106549 RepID=A0A540KNU7_MALBA|nr:hypothetical protein C1H46_038574 [Malus baccata]
MADSGAHSSKTMDGKGSKKAQEIVVAWRQKVEAQCFAQQCFRCTRSFTLLNLTRMQEGRSYKTIAAAAFPWWNFQQLEMWNLISNRRLTSRGSQTPSPGGSAIATSTPDVTTADVPQVMPLGSTVYMALSSSTSSVMHPILSAQQTHRQPWSSEEAQQSGEASFVHEKGSHTGQKKPRALAGYKRLLRPLVPRPRRSPLRGILDIVRLQQRSHTLRWPSTLARLSRTIAPLYGNHGELSNKESRK